MLPWGSRGEEIVSLWWNRATLRPPEKPSVFDHLTQSSYIWWRGPRNKHGNILRLLWWSLSWPPAEITMETYTGNHTAMTGLRITAPLPTSPRQIMVCKQFVFPVSRVNAFQQTFVCLDPMRVICELDYLACIVVNHHVNRDLLSEWSLNVFKMLLSRLVARSVSCSEENTDTMLAQRPLFSDIILRMRWDAEMLI